MWIQDPTEDWGLATSYLTINLDYAEKEVLAKQYSITWTIHLNIINNIDSIAVYIDFRKAFDTVNHVTLLNKLKQNNRYTIKEN